MTHHSSTHPYFTSLFVFKVNSYFILPVRDLIAHVSHLSRLITHNFHVYLSFSCGVFTHYFNFTCSWLVQGEYLAPPVDLLFTYLTCPPVTLFITWWRDYYFLTPHTLLDSPGNLITFPLVYYVDHFASSHLTHVTFLPLLTPRYA